MFHTFTIKISGILIDIFLQPGFFTPESMPISNIHEHSSYEFHYIAKGTAKLNSNSKIKNMSGGNFYIIAPHTYHSISATSEKLCKISFLFSLKETKHSNLYKSIIDNLTLFSQCKCPYNLSLLFELLLNYISDTSQANLNEQYMQSIFTLIFLNVLECVAPESSSKEDSQSVSYHSSARKDLINSYLAENITNATLEGLSNALYLSKRQTSRFLKETMDETFSSLLTKQRMEYTRALIKSQKYTLDNIALLCGYNSYKGFYLAFLKYFNSSPKEYIKNSADTENNL